MKIESENPYKISLSNTDRLLTQLNIILNLNLDSLYMHYLSDVEILDINNAYLNHDYFTDIITFDLRDEDSQEAEIFISIERVKENAKEYGYTYEEELCRVCIHGMLHLSGIGDKTVEEKKTMREVENKYLNRLFHVKL